MQQAGKLMMIAGVLIFALGIVLFFGGRYFHWFGHLPGDIKIDKGNVKFYMPLASMILVSIVLSLLMWIFRKFMH